ncbi:MAG: hypothetical protein AAF805_00250 [Planctomycetota bacterium]
MGSRLGDAVTRTVAAIAAIPASDTLGVGVLARVVDDPVLDAEKLRDRFTVQAYRSGEPRRRRGPRAIQHLPEVGLYFAGAVTGRLSHDAHHEIVEAILDRLELGPLDKRSPRLTWAETEVETVRDPEAAAAGVFLASYRVRYAAPLVTR